MALIAVLVGHGVWGARADMAHSRTYGVVSKQMRWGGWGDRTCTTMPPCFAM